MPFPFDKYPWLNFQELNLAYFIDHFREIFQQWADLLEDQEAWKDATTAELEEWKTAVETGISSWETGLEASMSAWKTQTETDISSWETATLAALDAWKTATTAVFEAIRTEAAASATSAAGSATSAAAAKTAAETAQAAAEAAAASIASSAAQIATNTADIATLKTNGIYWKGTIPSGANLNTYIVNGAYGISISVRDSLLNKPSTFDTGSGLLLVEKGGHSGNNVVTQLLFTIISTKCVIYMRCVNADDSSVIYGWRIAGGSLEDETGASTLHAMTQASVTSALDTLSSSLDSKIVYWRSNLSGVTDLSTLRFNALYSISTSQRDELVDKPDTFTSGTGALIVLRGAASGGTNVTQYLVNYRSGGYTIYMRLLNSSGGVLYTWRVIAGSLATSTGDSETQTMTQKAITDAINNRPFLTWAGKTLAIFGDSRTWYDGKTYTETTKTEWRGQTCVGYQEAVKGVIGTASVLNQGVSGNTSIQIASRIKVYDFTDVDALVIAGGVNDFVKSSQAPLGSIAPIGSTFDTETVYGALQDAIETIMGAYPSMKIYVIVPAIAWVGGSVFPEATANVRKNIAELYDLPYLDLYHLAGITEINRAYFYADDPELTNAWYLHFNDYGNKWIGDMIGKFFNSI